MTPPDGTYKLDPSNASLRVMTTRQGVAAKVGHDLVMEVGSWDASLTLAGGEPSCELTADSKSLNIIEGTGGAKPLSDGDRKKIGKNIDNDILGGKPIHFRSTGAGTGELEMGGTTNPASVDLTISDDGAISGRARLKQTDWGIKPYSGFMGALKVADEVEIAVEGHLP